MDGSLWSRQNLALTISLSLCKPLHYRHDRNAQALNLITQVHNNFVSIFLFVTRWKSVILYPSMVGQKQWRLNLLAHNDYAHTENTFSPSLPLSLPSLPLALAIDHPRPKPYLKIAISMNVNIAFAPVHNANFNIWSKAVMFFKRLI